jgi:ferredoxin
MDYFCDNHGSSLSLELGQEITMHTAIVYIEPGCIACHACTANAPDIFLIPEDHAVIKGDVRVDHITSNNAEERAALISTVDWDLIEEAAEGCPIEIIKIV